MKFTKEFIAQERERIRTFRVLTHAEKVAQAALDEIERLQAENDLLQTNRMCLNRDLVKEQIHAQELEQELKNKCANCGLASRDIWGDEDNVYDNLSTEEE